MRSNMACTVAFFACVSLCLTAVSSDALAQDQCIAPSVGQELFACDSGAAANAPTRRRGSPAAMPNAVELPTPTQTTPDPALETPTANIPGLSGTVRRCRLLEREIAVLQRLRRRTPAADPRHGDVLHRLAETLSELVNARSTRAALLDEPIFQARQASNAATVTRLTRDQTSARERARATRQETIEVLAELVQNHPNRAGLDRSLFTLAYHVEQLGLRSRARQVFHRLIRDFPASEYVPHAYLAFGELYFAEGDLAAAGRFYERILEIPPERNSVYGYARYKLAWTRYNQDDFRGALNEFVATLEFARQHPDRTESSSLVRQIRRELVLPYSRVGRPRLALAFFRRAAADQAEALGMLESLATLYHDTGQWSESIAVHRQLMAERSGAEALCTWQSRVLDATVSSRPKREQVREAERLVAIHQRNAPTQPAPVVRACAENTATTLILLATAWHREAVGTDDQPGTRDNATMDSAALLYGLIERGFPNLEDLELERIDARDRPSLARIAYFNGDLLFERQNWSACAEAFSRVLENATDPQVRADAAYVSVLCYDRHLGSRQPPPTPEDRALTQRELTQDEQRMARTFSTFACVAPRHEELPTVLYRWARLYYEANQLESAGVLFRRIAMDHPSAEVGEYAASLYLDTVNMLGERRGRTACFATLRAALTPLAERYCEDPSAHSDLCPNIGELRCTAGAQQAQQLSREGRHHEAGSALLELVRGENRCPDAPRYLYSAAIEFESARLLGRAIRVRSVLWQNFENDPEWRDLVYRAVFQIGANYHALAIYELAAEWYERYAELDWRCTPFEGQECPDSVDGLSNAIFFRIGLGQNDEASHGVRLFERRFARSDAARTAQVVFAYGSVFQRADDHARTISYYRSFLRRFRRSATPTQLAQANVHIARAHIGRGDRSRAAPFLRAAIQIHARGAEEVIGASELDGRAQRRSIAELRDAVAEARFEQAEDLRLRFRALRFPAFRGSATIDRVNRWAERDLRPWLEEKRLRLVAAEDAYNALAPLAIPRWRIAAASRIGDMYLHIVEHLRVSPIPNEIRRFPDVLFEYEELFIRVTEPIEAVAVERYESCLNTATDVRWFDAHSRRCETALNSLHPARFPIAAELRGRPAYLPPSVARPGAADLDPSPLDG